MLLENNSIIHRDKTVLPALLILLALLTSVVLLVMRIWSILCGEKKEHQYWQKDLQILRTGIQILLALGYQF